MCLGIFTFIALIGSPETGISAFVGGKLGAIFAGRPAIIFVALVAIITIVLTNLMANMIVAIIMISATLPLAAQLGIDPMQLGFLITVCSSIAFCLPASSPAGQYMFMNKEWLSSKEIWTFAIPTVIMMSIVAIAWNMILFLF